MGGIRLVEPPSAEGTNVDTEKGPSGHDRNPEGGRETILTFEMLQELDPEFKIRIPENEIAERSKGDALSKIIFLSQTSWFMLQCLARRIQGLDISHLELTTMAMASVNAATFILWWDKPLGLQAVVRVYLNRKLTDVERKVEGVSDFFASTSILTSNCSEVSLHGPRLFPTSKRALKRE